MLVSNYVIVFGTAKSPRDAAEELRAEVLKGLKGGWQPIGGVSLEAEQLSDGTLGFIAAQAMGK